MFGTIRRHQKWLWWFIVIIVVVSFVAFFNPNSKLGGKGGGPATLGSVSGEPVTMEDYRAARSEILIHYFLSHGEWPDKDTSAKQFGFDAERETYYRLFLISKFNEYKLHVGSDAVGKLAGDVLRSFQKNSHIESPEDFEKEVLKPRGLTLADFERFLRNELALRQLVAIVTTSGRLITTPEAVDLYRLENQQITTEAVFFSPSNQLANVTITPAALGQFYTNQMARYRLPDRVQVSYVKFELTNFWAEADQEIAKITNYTERVDALYLQRGTNYYTEAKTPEEAKTKIKEDDRRALALRAARNAAAKFADELLGRTPVQPANLDTLAAEKKMKVRVTAPFDVQNGPTEFTVPPSFAKTAFKLTAEDPFAGPLVAEDGVYVIASHKTLPSEIPSLETIRAGVQADARFIQAAQLAQAAGTNFGNTLNTGLKAGKTFSAICAEAKLTPVKLPPFALSSRSIPELENRISLGQLQQAAFSLPVGATSTYIPNNDGGGFILHIISRVPPSEEKVAAESPAFLNQVRQTRAGEAFNAWFSREAQVALRDTPLSRPKNAAQP